MIRTLSVSGFKSLYKAEIELGRVNCFIGANGVGKSNILEAIGVLGAAANGVVDDESLERRGVRPGVPSLYKSSFDRKRTPAHIGLESRGSAGEAYRVSLLNPLKSPEPAWRYKTEVLHDGSEEILSAGVRTNTSKGLAALNQVTLSDQNQAYQLLDSLQKYAIYCPNTPTLRGKADSQSRSPVGLNGGQVAEGFSDMVKWLEGQGEEGEDIFDQVVGLIDWVKDIQATGQAGSLLSSNVPRPKVMLKFTDRFMAKSRNELTAHDASEGALYIIFTALLCLSPNAPRVFSIDNIDQALNPVLLTKLISRLTHWLRFSDPNRQILFTSHNPAVLDGLDLTDSEVRLFAVNRNNHGVTSISRIEPSEKLFNLSKDYPLSRLWLMGHLGAVPNV